jgi:hypothetical protein
MKMVPIEKERAYIKLTERLESLSAEHTKLKKEMLTYNEKGYGFELLKFSDTSSGVFSPPWKQLCLELLKRFMKPKQRTEWLLNLRKRFKPREKSPTIYVLGKQAKINV